MTVTVKTTGFKELEQELERISKRTTRKSVARRVLKKEAQPLAELMRQGAPRDDTDLVESIAVSTKLSPRQRGLHRKMFRDDKAAVEMFVGAGPLPQAHLQEFGTWFHPPQPWARPAWDQDHRAMLDRISKSLWEEVQKAAARAERRAARQAAKG